MHPQNRPKSMNVVTNSLWGKRVYVLFFYLNEKYFYNLNYRLVDLNIKVISYMQS